MTREEAINYLEMSMAIGEDDDSRHHNEVLEFIIKTLEQEPRKGKWISEPHVYGVTYCSECNFELKIADTNYCPNCGAKMESEE